MRSKYERSKFIKILEEAPFVSYAAKKVGISRASIYRWQKNDPEFKMAINRALNSGRDQLIDVAEMALIEKIKSKDMGAIKFFLQHNDIRYRPVRTTYVPPNNDDDITGVKHCPVCREVKALRNMPYKEAREYYMDTIKDLGFEITDKETEVNADSITQGDNNEN